MSSLPFDALFAPGAEADLLRAVLDDSEEGIVVCDAQGAVRYFNRSMCRMLGLPERSLPPERWQAHYELFAADGVTPLRPDQAPLWRALHEGDVRDTEIVIVPRTGLPQAVSFNGRALFAPDGKLGAVVRMHNVTEARALSREREGMQVAWLSAVLTSVEEGIVAADANGNVVECNAAALAMHDFQSVEQARRHLGEYAVHFELRTPDGETVPVEAWPMARALRGETFAQLELRMRRFDRPWERILTYSGTTIRSASGNVSLALLTIRDVTARRRAEQLLAQSQRQMELVVKGANVGVWYCPPPFDRLVWDGKVKEHFHLPPDTEVTIETFYERLHPDDRERTRQAIETSIQTREPYDIEYRTVSPDGTRTTWVHL